MDVVDGIGDDDEVAVIMMGGGADCGIAAAAISQLSVPHRRFVTRVKSSKPSKRRSSSFLELRHAVQ